MSGINLSGFGGAGQRCLAPVKPDPLDGGRMLRARDYVHLVPCAQEMARLDYSASTRPRDFLEFAIEDLESGADSRNRVNAVSNAKRAIHYQGETVAAGLGVQHASKKYRSNFPGLLDFLAGCGVVSSRLLRKLNSVRNAMEHDYDFPTSDTAETFVDVAELFLSATDRLVFNFPTELSFEEPSQLGHEQGARIWCITMKPCSGTIRLCLEAPNRREHAEYEEEEYHLECAKLGIDPENHPWGGLPEDVQRRASERATDRWMDDPSQKHSAIDGGMFFEWVALFLRKSAEHSVVGSVW